MHSTWLGTPRGDLYSNVRKRRQEYVEVKNKIFTTGDDEQLESGLTPMESYVLRRELDRSTMADPEAEPADPAWATNVGLANSNDSPSISKSPAITK